MSEDSQQDKKNSSKKIIPHLFAPADIVNKQTEKQKDEMNNWDAWGKEFFNAKAFFTTKGNVHTQSALKDKWNKEFMKIISYFFEQGKAQAISEFKKKLKRELPLFMQQVNGTSVWNTHLIIEKTAQEMTG
jgi:hypothetical protein